MLTADAEQALTDIQRAGVDSINYTQFFNTVSSSLSKKNREVRDDPPSFASNFKRIQMS